MRWLAVCAVDGRDAGDGGMRCAEHINSAALGGKTYALTVIGNVDQPGGHYGQSLDAGYVGGGVNDRRLFTVRNSSGEAAFPRRLCIY